MRKNIIFFGLLLSFPLQAFAASEHYFETMQRSDYWKVQSFLAEEMIITAGETEEITIDIAEEDAANFTDGDVETEFNNDEEIIGTENSLIIVEDETIQLYEETLETDEPVGSEVLE